MYTLIILDLNSADLRDSSQVTEQIRDIFKDLPQGCPYICVCLNEEYQEDEEQIRSTLMQARVDRVMMKPIEITEVVQILELLAIS